VAADFRVTLEEPMSGVVATTVLSFAPSVYDVLGNPRRRGRPPARLVRDTAYRALEDSLLGPVPSLTERTVEIGRSSFAMVLENDLDIITVTGEYGGGEAIVRREPKPR
jgi:hypothetical protein